MSKKLFKTGLLVALVTLFCSFSSFAADEGDGVISDAIEPRATKEWYFYNVNGETGKSGLAAKADSEQTAYLRTTNAVYGAKYSIKFYTEVKNSSNTVVCSPFTIYGITLYTTPYSKVRGVAGSSYQAHMKNQTGDPGISSLSGRWTP